MEHYPFLLCYQQYFLLNNSIYRYRKKRDVHAIYFTEIKAANYVKFRGKMGLQNNQTYRNYYARSRLVCIEFICGNIPKTDEVLNHLWYWTVFKPNSSKTSCAQSKTICQDNIYVFFKWIFIYLLAVYLYFICSIYLNILN